MSLQYPANSCLKKPAASDLFSQQLLEPFATSACFVANATENVHALLSSMQKNPKTNEQRKQQSAKCVWMDMWNLQLTQRHRHHSLEAVSFGHFFLCCNSCFECVSDMLCRIIWHPSLFLLIVMVKAVHLTTVHSRFVSRLDKSSPLLVTASSSGSPDPSCSFSATVG